MSIREQAPVQERVPAVMVPRRSRRSSQAIRWSRHTVQAVVVASIVYLVWAKAVAQRRTRAPRPQQAPTPTTRSRDGQKRQLGAAPCEGTAPNRMSTADDSSAAASPILAP